MRPLTAGEEDLEEPTEQTPLLQGEAAAAPAASPPLLSLGGGGGGDRGRHAKIEEGVVSPKSGKSRVNRRSKRSSEFSTPTSCTDQGSSKSQSDLISFLQRQLGRDMNLTPRGRDAFKHYRPPSSRSLVFQHVILLSGYVVYMLTSWVYCCFERAALFQKCSLVWPARDSRFVRWAEVACFVSTLSWWTFPLICCLMLVNHFYRDLMHTRIWYEMFAHKVIINFECKNFLTNSPKKALFLLLWFTLGSTMYVFEKKYTRWAAIQATFPYWLPLISFALVLYNQWSLDNMLLSVAKFVGSSADDCLWAGDHLSQCYYTTEHDAGRAWKRAHQEFCDRGDRSDSDESASETETSLSVPESPEQGGGRSCSGTTDRSSILEPETPERAPRGSGATDQSSNLEGHKPSFTTGGLVQALTREMRRREKEQLRRCSAELQAFRGLAGTTSRSSASWPSLGLTRSSRPSLDRSSTDSSERPVFWEEVDFAHNWVRLFLYSQRLEDDHAKRFRKWFKLFEAYVIVLVSGLLYLVAATLICHFVHQGALVLPEGPGLTGWVRRLAVQPLDDLQESMTSMRHMTTMAR